MAQGAWAADVRTGSGRPHERSPELQEYLDRLDAEDAAAAKANEEARIADEALRREKASEIAAHNARVNEWLKANPPPPGTTETLVVDHFDDAYNPGEVDIVYINKDDIPTHTVQLDTGYQPTGPVTLTQQGKAWETIGPQTEGPRSAQLQYGSSLDGQDIIITEATITEGGKPVARYEFNQDGVPWRGETFDRDTGRRTGGFQDDRLKPQERSLGGPLAVPTPVRIMTQPCEKCRPLVERANAIATEINTRIAEMRRLSDEHQTAYNPAQGPIQERHAVLKAQVDALTPQYEAALREALACDKTCRAEAPDQPYESILDEIEETNPFTPRESILDEIEEPQRPTPTAREPEVQPTKDVYPPTDEDLERVLQLANDYLAAANCDGMKCPKIDCPEARRALQALIDMEAYVKQMVFYTERADDDHMAHLRALAESNILNGQQRDLLIRVIAIQEFYHNFGSMLLDIASIMSFFKDIAQDGGDPKSITEVMDKINDLYELAKDAESLSATATGSLSGEKAATPIADAVNVAGGVDAGSINDLTSNITDIKSIAVSAREIYEDATKNGKDWRQEFKKKGILADLGQLAGRYLKGWSQANLEERQQRLKDLLSEAEAGDIVQAQAFVDLQRAQRRRWAAVDALAALQDAREAYAACVTRACGLQSVAGPVIPEFEHVVAGTNTTKYDWGAALRWLNGAIAQTLPKMRPVPFRDDCPKDESRADPGQPQTQIGDLPPGAVRPQFERVDLILPASFCSEFERVDFLNNTYNPAAAAALRNATTAQQYAATLNGLFTQYMRNEGGPVWAAIQVEMAEWKPIAAEAQARAEGMPAVYNQILAIPIVDCPQTAQNNQIPSTGQPLTPVDDKPAKPGKPDCPPEERRKPITVGPNSKVGSGARLKAKAASTALGIAGGLLGSAAGLPSGGGGGGGGGPPTVICKITDKEMTVFNDPASGVSLKVGAKRAGGTVVVFADIAKSPDNGTFQTGFLENPRGEAMAPADVGICDLWGEWKLTVSWTKSTYVDGQLVKQESGGWSKLGRFVIPGTLSTVDRPDGLWKRLGFSNASHGARKIAMQYKLPPGGGPVDLIVHVTRPSGDPVTTVPFALRLVEGPKGFTITRAPDAPCPPESILDDVEESPPVIG